MRKEERAKEADMQGLIGLRILVFILKIRTLLEMGQERQTGN